MLEYLGQTSTYLVLKLYFLNYFVFNLIFKTIWFTFALN